MRRELTGSAVTVYDSYAVHPPFFQEP